MALSLISTGAFDFIQGYGTIIATQWHVRRAEKKAGTCLTDGEWINKANIFLSSGIMRAAGRGCGEVKVWFCQVSILRSKRVGQSMLCHRVLAGASLKPRWNLAGGSLGQYLPDTICSNHGCLFGMGSTM